MSEYRPFMSGFQTFRLKTGRYVRFSDVCYYQYSEAPKTERLKSEQRRNRNFAVFGMVSFGFRTFGTGLVRSNASLGRFQ